MSVNCRVFNQFNFRNGDSEIEGTRLHSHVTAHEINQYNFNVQDAELQIQAVVSNMTVTLISPESLIVFRKAGELIENNTGSLSISSKK